MKYKLINLNTKQETLCDKVTIDGFDYYVSDKEPTLSDTLNTCYYVFNNVLYKREYSHHTGCKKVIATTNSNINIPKVVDEVLILAKDNVDLSIEDWVHGYIKSQETHPFSEQDMIDFLKFYKFYTIMLKREEWENLEVSEDRLIELWKEQQPKTIYYE